MQYKNFNNIDSEFNEFIFSNKKNIFHTSLHANLYKLKIITLKEKSESIYIQKIMGYNNINKDKLFYNIEVPDLYTELIVIQKDANIVYLSSLLKTLNIKNLLKFACSDV